MPENYDTTAPVAFVHRYCEDGTIDSICLCCYLTACRCGTLQQSLEEEVKHACLYDLRPASARLHLKAMSAAVGRTVLNANMLG